jgi:hypothetical protein
MLLLLLFKDFQPFQCARFVGIHVDGIQPGPVVMDGE